MICGKLQFKIIIKYNQRTGIMYKKVNNQQKQYFSVEINQKPKYVPKVQPRKSNQHNVEWIKPNNFQSETNHEFIHRYKHTNNFDIDKLDLIFKKEPKDIQQKLMKLLISYNAVMKYNKDTDMFEVDLLLPFLNQQQKKQFIKQFLQVRQKQNIELRPQRQQSSIQQGKIKETNDQNEDLYGSKQLKKFSFNLKQYLPSQDQQLLIQQNNATFGGNHQIHTITHVSQNLAEQFDKTAEFYLAASKSNEQQLESEEINLKQIDNVIAFRLKNAVDKIRKRKGQQKNMYIGENISKALNDDSLKQQESIIDQISNPSFNNTQNTSEYKQLSVSQYIKEEQQVLFREIKSNRQPYFNSRSHEQQTYTSLRKPYMQIEEQPCQEEDYEPLFKKNQLYTSVNNDKNKKTLSFQDYTQKLVNKKTNNKKTSSINQRQTDKSHKNINKTTKNQVLTAKQYESTKTYSPQKNKAKYGLKRQQDSSKKSTTSNNNINNRHSPISKESRKIQNQVEQFFNTHKKNLNNIYAQIKDKLSQRQKLLDNHQQQEGQQKLLEKLYILVQEQTQEEDDKVLKQIPEESQNSYFRQEIMKRYHKQILVNNKNLSSQELVKYFKFLHLNAKRIYIKYLQNKNK